jgi:ornithine cyclodeaminase/alanine dehydrogenase-like protein (mu-crystallin family)
MPSSPAALASARSRVLAAERAYVAQACGRPVESVQFDPGAKLAELAFAAASAVASRFLAVGTPRSIGIVGGATARDAQHAAHATWFVPAEVRWVAEPTADGALRACLASDIVCVCLPIVVDPSLIRRGTHLNLCAGAKLAADPSWRVVRESSPDDASDLGKIAAGFTDGRELDEITVFAAGDLGCLLGPGPTSAAGSEP